MGYVIFSVLGGHLSEKEITQTPLFISAKIWDEVNLTCLYLSDEISSGVIWMKLPVGEKPVAVVSIYSTFTKYHNDFDKSGRFKVESEAGSFNLTISQTQTADSATYYCGYIYYSELTFGEGTVLFVRGKLCH